MERLAAWLKNGDHRVLYYVNLQIRGPLLDWLMPKISHLGGASFTVSFFLLLFALSCEFALEGLSALAASHLFVQLLKRFFARARPYLSDHNVLVWKNPLRDYSFPSGHSTAIFSLVATVSLSVPWIAVLLIPIAACVALSRIYLGLHYPTDVGIGALIGIVFAFGAHFFTSIVAIS